MKWPEGHSHSPHSVNLAWPPHNQFLLITHYCLVLPQLWGREHGPLLQGLQRLWDKSLQSYLEMQRCKSAAAALRKEGSALSERVKESFSDTWTETVRNPEVWQNVDVVENSKCLNIHDKKGINEKLTANIIYHDWLKAFYKDQEQDKGVCSHHFYSTS